MVNVFKSKLLKSISDEEIEITRQQTEIFKTAILSKDLLLLSTILNEKYTYIEGRNKAETIAYFADQFSKFPNHNSKPEDIVATFYCYGCQQGNIALRFLYGCWPIIETKEYVDKSIVLAFKNGLISDLTICYGYCSAERIQEIAIQN